LGEEKESMGQNSMSHMYVKGEGVKQSYEMARRLFEQAAQQGYVTAIFSLGIITMVKVLSSRTKERKNITNFSIKNDRFVAIVVIKKWKILLQSYLFPTIK
jgi:hypothetical protein